MIFVTLGTQKQSFKRLLDYLENIEVNEDIYIQNGNTVYYSQKMHFLGFLTYEEMEHYIEKSHFVISHGGGGSIFLALKHQKKVICVPRLSEYQEHVNNHQIEMINSLVMKNYIIACQNQEQLATSIYNIDKIALKAYEFHPEHFVMKIKKLIDETLELS